MSTQNHIFIFTSWPSSSWQLTWLWNIKEENLNPFDPGIKEVLFLQALDSERKEALHFCIYGQLTLAVEDSLEIYN